MARQVNRLSAVGLQKIGKPGRYADGGGLYLRVAPSLARSWVFRWVRGGAEREMGLGSFPDVTLATARDLARDCRQHVAAGRDPLAERNKARETAKTFGDVADELFKAMRPKWAAKTARQWQHTFTVEAKQLRPLPIASADTADVLRVLKPIWQAKNVTAVKVRYRIEAAFDYAKARGWREGENPARWRGHLSNILPARSTAVTHRPAMHYQDVPAFMAQLAMRDSMAALALRLLILTACRTGEVLQAQWSEFDLEAAVWAIPGARMKAKRDHRVPLTGDMLAILRPLYENRISDYVFPGQRPHRPLSNMALAMLLRRMKIEGVSPHGFRSSFRDFAGDQTSFPREIAEAALAHRLGDNVELAYRRSDALERRRQLMTVWGDHCAGRSGGKVVAING